VIIASDWAWPARWPAPAPAFDRPWPSRPREIEFAEDDAGHCRGLGACVAPHLNAGGGSAGDIQTVGTAVRAKARGRAQGILDWLFIRACFDESIRQDFDEPMAYEKFKRQWHRTVLRYGKRRFTAFHMFVFAGNDEYEGMLAEDRAAILDAAVSAIGPRLCWRRNLFRPGRVRAVRACRLGAAIREHLRPRLQPLSTSDRVLVGSMALPDADRLSVRAGHPPVSRMPGEASESRRAYNLGCSSTSTVRRSESTFSRVD
jgi:hypothetical protein